MEPHILLAQLRSLLERVPNFDEYRPTSREHQTWLAQAHALVSRWNSLEGVTVQVSSGFMDSVITRDSHVSKILACVYRAIADLELLVPAEEQAGFGAGDVYDFFKALNKVVASAEKSLFIIDPYLDPSVFNHYLASRNNGADVRLLSSKKAQDLAPSVQKYNAQYGDVLELRKSNMIHDRMVFVDGYVCWLVGQSLKDAAKAKPTYLVQAPPDLVSEKLSIYDNLWEKSTPL